MKEANEAIRAKANKVEALVSNRGTRADLIYALQAVLIELSNESGVGVCKCDAARDEGSAFTKKCKNS